MLFIMVLFHLSPFKNFKVFYHYGIGQQYRACFGDIPHYDRFVSLMPRLFAPLMVLLHSLNGEETGICFAASSKLAVCHNRRIHRHKVFDGLAARGKTGMGWFFGLELHFVINHKGQIMALQITPGNTADSAVLDDMTRHPTGKAFAGKGYIGKDLFKKIWRRDPHPSPHFAADRNPPNSPLLSSISANRCISGSSRCCGMFGISSSSMHP
jgi:Transposase DDE domain